MQTVFQTPCGPLKGVPSPKAEGVIVFRGVRYATAGRFQYPEEIRHWEGTYDAGLFGPCAWQPRSFYNEAEMPEKAFYYNEFRRGEYYEYNEDCLFLNIWAPEGAQNAPVLVYIHGGGFIGGCGHEKHFEGEAWCKKGVIFVTMNYRLGPLGFLCHPWYAEESGHTGNYGLYDQVTALKWVKHNISAFGGDPDRITVMGQSAGAMSIQHLAISPLTDGLFCGAIMLSGGGVSKLMNAGASSAENAHPFWEAVAEECHVQTADAFRQLPVEQLFSAWQTVQKKQKGHVSACGPCRDGALIPESGMDCLSKHHQKKIPYLLCSTSEDMVPPIIQSMAKNWCDRQHAQGNPDSYCALFRRQLPGDNRGAWHSSDLWYALGTLDNCWRPFTEADHALSDAMVTYYTNFAKTGNPNDDGCGSHPTKKNPLWLPARKSQKKVMVFDVPHPAMGKVPKARLIWNMLTKKPVGE